MVTQTSLATSYAANDATLLAFGGTVGTAVNALTKIAAQQANAKDYGAVGDGTTDDTTAITAAVNTGNPVYLPPGRYLAALALTDQSLNISGPGVLVQQQALPVLSVVRTWGSPLSCTVGTVQWGPNVTGLPAGTNTETYTTATLSSYAAHKAGDLFHLCSNDAYPWATYAVGSATVWKAEFFRVLGIGINLSAVAVLPAEGDTLTGLTSGVTAVVQSVTDLGGSAARVLFSSISADFTAAETIKRGATTIGTLGSIYLVKAGKSTDTYTTTPALRKVDQAPQCHIDVTIDANGNTESVVGGGNRVQSILLQGVYRPTVRVRVRNAWTRAINIKSCYGPDVDARVDGIPNHPADNAYGYGIELRGCTEGGRYKILGSWLRHGVTTNPNGSTWVNQTIQEYGTVKYNTFLDSVIFDSLCAGFDCHEGAYFTTYRNCRVVNTANSNRGAGSAGGFNDRGFGTTYYGCSAEGVLWGWKLESAAADAGFKYWTRVKNCDVVNFQAVAFWQSAKDANDRQRIRYSNCDAVGDGSTGTPYLQVGWQVTQGKTKITNCSIEQFSGAPIYFDASSGGTLEIRTFDADYLDASSVTAMQVAGSSTRLQISEYRLTPPTSGLASWFENVSGTNNWAIESLKRSGSNTLPGAVVAPTSGTVTMSVRDSTGLKAASTFGDANGTFTPFANNAVQRWDTALTTTRTCTLSKVAGACVTGNGVRVVRTAAATGASVLNVLNGAGGATLKALAVGTWGDFRFDGTDWILDGYGTL